MESKDSDSDQELIFEDALENVHITEKQDAKDSPLDIDQGSLAGPPESVIQQKIKESSPEFRGECESGATSQQVVEANTTKSITEEERILQENVSSSSEGNVTQTQPENRESEGSESSEEDFDEETMEELLKGRVVIIGFSF